MRVLRISLLALVVLFLVASSGAYAQTAENYYSKGAEYGTQGRFEEAEKEFKKALEYDWFKTSAKKCLKLIEDALEKRVENEVTIHLFKGIAYGYKGMIDEEIAELKKATTINPNYVEALNGLGLAYGYKGMLDEEIAEYKKAIAVNPNYAEAHNNLGLAYDNKGMHDEAIAEFRKAIDSNPDYAEVHYYLALAYYGKRQYDLAIKHCDKAIEMGYKVTPGFLEYLKPYRK